MGPLTEATASRATSWKDDLYDYRKESIELLFQRIIQASGLKERQVKREDRNGEFVLARVWLCQICYLRNCREGKPLACIKDHLDCSRWSIPSGLIAISFNLHRLHLPSIVCASQSNSHWSYINSKSVTSS
jgi:hypothetical protein